MAWRVSEVTNGTSQSLTSPSYVRTNSRCIRPQVLAPTLVDRLPLRKTSFAEDDVLTKCWEGSDGRWFMAMMPFRADHFWPLLCQAIGRAEWASMYDARDRWDARALVC